MTKKLVGEPFAIPNVDRILQRALEDLELDDAHRTIELAEDDCVANVELFNDRMALRIILFQFTTRPFGTAFLGSLRWIAFVLNKGNGHSGWAASRSFDDLGRQIAQIANGKAAFSRQSDAWNALVRL